MSIKSADKKPSWAAWTILTRYAAVVPLQSPKETQGLSNYSYPTSNLEPTQGIGGCNACCITSVCQHKSGLQGMRAMMLNMMPSFKKSNNAMADTIMK
jgi:hypothetical protein